MAPTPPYEPSVTRTDPMAGPRARPSAIDDWEDYGWVSYSTDYYEHKTDPNKTATVSNSYSVSFSEAGQVVSVETTTVTKTDGSVTETYTFKTTTTGPTGGRRCGELVGCDAQLLFVRRRRLSGHSHRDG